MPMSDIYEQHKAAFNRVSASAIVDNKGERVASIAFKYPADGAGRLYCYLHIFGVAMVRGSANGGGYDKASAAAYDASLKLKVEDGANPEMLTVVKQFQAALKQGDGGSRWDNALREAGYRSYGAI